MKWLKKALGRTGRKVAEEHVTRGYIAAHEGRLDQAQKHYADAIDADETLAVAFFNAGQTELERFNRDVTQAGAGLDAAARAQRLSTAATLLEQGLALEPQHAPSWRTLGRVRERQRSYAAAVLAWQNAERALTEQPGEAADPTGSSSSSSSSSASTQPDPAAFAETRKEIARLAPFADLETALSAARTALASRAAAGVTVDAATAERTSAERAAALDLLLSTWERVRLVGVDEPPRLFALAGALARSSGRNEQARGLLEQAVQRDKHDLEAWKDLATLCLADGDLKAALSSSMAAYREDPVDAGLVCNVGVCHLALGDLDKAAEFIELASSMSEKDPIVARAVAALTDARAAKRL